MPRFRSLAIAAVLSVAAMLAAQQNPAAVATVDVDQHLALLSEKLDLTADQQTRTRPILQQMHDSSQTVVADETISPQERQERIHTIMLKADRQLREILNDEQKKKLDAMEEQMHHGDSAPHPSAQQ